MIKALHQPFICRPLADVSCLVHDNEQKTYLNGIHNERSDTADSKATIESLDTLDMIDLLRNLEGIQRLAL